MIAPAATPSAQPQPLYRPTDNDKRVAEIVDRYDVAVYVVNSHDCAALRGQRHEVH